MVIRDALNFFRQPFARIAAVLAVILMVFGAIDAVANWVASSQSVAPFDMDVEIEFHVRAGSIFDSLVPGFIVLFLAIATEYASRITSDLRFLRSKAEARHKEP